MYNHLPPPPFCHTWVDTGKGPVVILLQGLFGNYRMWNHTVEDLKADYHVVIPQLPIFNLPSHHTNVNYLMKLLHDFIDWYSYQEVTLVGHALGGQVALMYAYTHPEKVSKLVITGSTGFMETPISDESFITKDIDQEYVFNTVSEAFYKSSPIMEYFVQEIYSTVKSHPHRKVIGSIMESSRQTDITNFLNKVDVSTLLIWGLQDKLSSPKIALHFYDFLRNAELKFIQECGHLPMVEQPAVFSKHIRAFLSAYPERC